MRSRHTRTAAGIPSVQVREKKSWEGEGREAGREKTEADVGRSGFSVLLEDRDERRKEGEEEMDGEGWARVSHRAGHLPLKRTHCCVPYYIPFTLAANRIPSLPSPSRSKTRREQLPFSLP